MNLHALLVAISAVCGLIAAAAILYVVLIFAMAWLEIQQQRATAKKAIALTLYGEGETE